MYELFTMETKESIISSESKLSAIAAVMFFAPFVKNRVKSDPIFTEEERDFIAWYVKVWFVNIVFFTIVLLALIINFFINNWIFSRIITIWSFVIFIILLFSIFACVNNLEIRNKNESIVQNIQHKWQILKFYTPIINFHFRYHQENYNMPYRRLKESVLLWTLFIFWTLLLWNSFGIGILIFIAVRIILLMLNIDIIPISIKKSINSVFSCNPWEIFAYIFTPIISKIKKSDYETILQTKKLEYQQWQSFWMWVIVQYILFIWILFLLHQEIGISFDNIILFIALTLWMIRIIIFYIHKKTFLRIPIFSEIVSLVFH